MKLKKIISGCLAVSILMTGFTISSKADMKISGKNRIETSIKSSELMESKIVVFANAYQHADSLSAFNLASKFDAKLILVDNNTDLSQLNIEKAYIVGGENSLNNKFEEKLRKRGITVKRVAGSNRYVTNRFSLSISNFNKVGVADGRGFADALSASALLKREGLGLLLVDGSKGYTSSREVKYTFGGKNSVKQDNGKRISGKNRYETSQKLNEMLDSRNIAITSGENFADALSAINVINSVENSSVLLFKKLDNGNRGLIEKAKDLYIIGGGLDTAKVESLRSKDEGVIRTQKEYEEYVFSKLKNEGLEKEEVLKVSKDVEPSAGLYDIVDGMGFKISQELVPEGNTNKMYIKMGIKRGKYTKEEYTKEEYKEEIEKIRTLVEKIKQNPNLRGFSNVDKMALYLKLEYPYNFNPGRHEDLSVEEQRESRSPYSIIKYNTAVCEGYTYAFNQMMLVMDIPSYYLQGFNDVRARHSRPCYYMNGTWHEIDVTGFVTLGLNAMDLNSELIYKKKLMNLDTNKELIEEDINKILYLY